MVPMHLPLMVPMNRVEQIRALGPAHRGAEPRPDREGEGQGHTVALPFRGHRDRDIRGVGCGHGAWPAAKQCEGAVGCKGGGRASGWHASLFFYPDQNVAYCCTSTAPAWSATARNGHNVFL